MAKFSVGDRVCRLEEVYDESSRLMHGTITNVYAMTSEYTRIKYDEVYEVQWDHKPDCVESGFLPHGLQAVVTDVS